VPRREAAHRPPRQGRRTRGALSAGAPCLRPIRRGRGRPGCRWRAAGVRRRRLREHLAGLGLHAADHQLRAGREPRGRIAHLDAQGVGGHLAARHQALDEHHGPEAGNLHRRPRLLLDGPTIHHDVRGPLGDARRGALCAGVRPHAHPEGVDHHATAHKAHARGLGNGGRKMPATTWPGRSAHRHAAARRHGPARLRRGCAHRVARRCGGRGHVAIREDRPDATG